MRMSLTDHFFLKPKFGTCLQPRMSFYFLLQLSFQPELICFCSSILLLLLQIHCINSPVFLTSGSNNFHFSACRADSHFLTVWFLSPWRSRLFLCSHPLTRRDSGTCVEGTHGVDLAYMILSCIHYQLLWSCTIPDK